MLNKMKRILALVMSIMMITSSMPVSALADTVTDYVTYEISDTNGRELPSTLTLAVGDEEDYIIYTPNSVTFALSGGDAAEITVGDSTQTDMDDTWGGKVKAWPVHIVAKGATDSSVEYGSLNSYNTVSKSVGWTSYYLNVEASRNKVSFNAGEGTGEMPAVTAGASYTLPECAFTAPDGMVFAGWEVNGQVYPANAKIELTGDITATATWGEKVTLSYDGSTYTQEAAKGGVVTLPNYSDVGLVAQDNMKFYGWATVAGATEAAYAAGDTLTLEGDTTLYPVWGEIKLNITLKVNHYYASGSDQNNYNELHHTDVVSITSHDANYLVSHNTFEGLLTYMKDKNPDVSGLVNTNNVRIDTEAGTVTINTEDVAVNDMMEGEVVINFYYTGNCTVGYRVDLTTGQELPERAGFVRSYPFDDFVVDTSFNKVEDFNVSLIRFAEKVKDKQFTGYENKGFCYKNPGDTEFTYVNSADNISLKAGGQFYKVFKLSAYVNSSDITWNRVYFNEFNAQFEDDNGRWEDFKGGNVNTYAYQGMKVAFTPSNSEAAYYSDGPAAIGYYADSDFYLWKYHPVQDGHPQSTSIADIEADSSYIDAGETYFQYGDSSEHKSRRYYLLYRFRKPTTFTVEYYVDDVQVGETETYTPRFTVGTSTIGDIVKVKSVPDGAVGVSDTEWIYKLFDYKGVENYEPGTSITFDDVTGKEASTFGMIDRHIKYYAYTPIKVYYVAEEGGAVNHDMDTVNRKSGEPLTGSVATPDAGYEFVGWYKKGTDELVSNDPNLSKQTAKDNLNYNETKKWYEETIFVAKFRKIPSAKIDITVTKIWEDSDYSLNRPTSVLVQLLADGENYGEPVELNAENEWSHTWPEVETEKEDGTRIEYTVAEISNIQGYTTTYGGDAFSGFTITNKHEIEKVSISGTKVWDDAENQDGKRPESITINLKVGNNVLATKEVSEVNGKWEFSFTDLDKYENGALINYTITEDKVTDYKDPVVSMRWDDAHTAASVTVTNSRDAEPTSVTVTKTWADGEDQDGLRPDTITVNLLANGEPVDGKVATFGADEDGAWTYTFTELPKYEDGKEIVYTITENPVDGYETSIDGFAITNSHTPATVKVEGTKTWDDANDQDGLRPEKITVQLLADGEMVDSVEVTAEDEWKYSFTNLPANKIKDGKGGVAIVYTVKEDMDADTAKAYTSTVSGYNIKNTHTPAVVTVEGAKTWDDANNQDGKRPTEIIINLLADGTVKESKQVTAADGWAWKWENLPKFAAGEEIAYTITEDAVKHYTSKVEGYNVTNTHTIEKVTVAGAKTWNDFDNVAGIRPESITINLLADGETIDSKTVTANDGWAWKWENLPKYAEGKVGDEITYTITENAVANYTTVVQGYNVENIYTPGETSVTVTKAWDDDGNRDGLRPASIIVKLLADGEEYKTAELTAPNWSATFEQLPIYKEGAEGVNVVYTVAEEQVPGYDKPVITGDATKGYTITNTHEIATTKVEGIKVWSDADNQDGIRKESVTIHLLADGNVVDSAVVDAASDWKFSFVNLPVNENGAKITYTVSEDEVQGYTTVITGDAAEGFTVTNSHTPEETEVSVTKVWEDEDNQDGLRPSKITIKLAANGKAVASKEVTAEDGWNWKFDKLPKYEGGVEITYTVSEDKVDGYTTGITGTAADGYTITNTHTPGVTSVSGTKTWNDEDNQDGKRPASITVNLLADGKQIDSATVTAANDWKYIFTGLPTHAEGKEIAYSVEEVLGVELVDVYTSEVDGYDITNTHEVEKTEVKVTKVWNDEGNQDNKRTASVTINLLADGTKTDAVELSEDNNWTYTFENLDKYSKGEEIEYTVEEATVPEGYEVAVTGDAATGYTVTNTHDIDTTKVVGAKTWTDNNDQDGKRPESITVNLLADGEIIKTATVTADNGWEWSFDNLPVNKAGKVGQAIEYTITEETVDGYETSIDGYDITNTHTIEKVSINGTKEWQDVNNQDGLRPESITINLLKNGDAFMNTTTDAEKGWEWSFTDLDKYEGGEEITYSIDEIAVEGYTTTGEELVWNENVATVALVNTHTPATTEIKVTKTWDDADDQDGKRPDSIKVQLLANGTQVDEATIVADQADKWEHTFTNLPVKAAGEEIAYTITETAVDGYTTVIDGFAITNTHEIIKTSVSGEKIWDDAENQDGKRPTSIKVNLLANGTEVDSADVAADVNGDWKFSFTDLPAYADGKLITYTVTEDKVDEYTTTIDGDVEKGFTITNSYTPGKTSVSGQKIWDDNDDQDGLRPESITVNLVATVEAINYRKVAQSATVTADANGDWKYTFTELPTHVAGKEIEYIVEEVLPENLKDIYTSKVEGTTIINTHEPYTTSISGEKFWDDNNDQDGKRPENITVNLLANGEKVKSATVTADGSGKWLYTFENLPVNKAGKAIEYTVTEEPVEGYTAAVEGTTITNTHKPETTSITGEKTWDDADNQDGKRPESITVNLLAVKGENEYELITSKNVTAEDGWTYTFDNLPVYAKGEKITYKVTEVAVADYTADYEGYDIENTHLVEKTKVKVTKDWNDADDQDGIRPESVTINLLADGTEAEAIELNDGNDWTYTFENLDKYSKGVEIKYTVEEAEVPDGYDVAVTGDAATGYTVINTHQTEKTSISGRKTWDDLDNDKGIRPASITVKVMNGTDVVATQTVTEENGWKYTFNGLEKNVGGQEIKYTIVEEPVDGYTATVTGYDILNKTEVPKISVTKTADVKEGLKVGDVVTYTITVTNTGNVDLLNVKVDDDQTNLHETIDLLPKGEIVELTTKHTTTEEDLLAGEYVNTAKAEGTSPEGEKTDAEDSETVETEEVEPALVVTKTADVTENVKVGDIITYTITVENTGNVTLKNITVTDDLTGDSWTIEELGVGETCDELTATYTVKESDLLNHQIKNIATATTTNPDDPTEEVKDDDDEIVKTEEVEPALVVTKTADVTENVKVGDIITYTITVENTGNVTLKNITVTDDLTGDSWTIDELGVGEISDELTATYVVTTDDILAGIIKNIATAETTNPDDPDEPVKDQDEEDVDPEPIDTTLTVEKTSDKQGKKVALGETIKYTITVKNDGNVDYTNVKVDDELTGDHWVIELLKVGEEKEFTTTYTVTSEDILKGIVLNSVTAKGDDIPDPDPDVPPHTPEDDDDEEDDPEDIDTTLTVEKTSDVTTTAQVGDTITYTITVKNDGNVDYTNVKVDDELTGLHETIAVLKVGESKTFTTTRIVTEADAEAGHILNVAVAKADPIPDPDDPDAPKVPEGSDDEDDPVDPVPEVPEEPALYRVTVRYWYEYVGGETAAKTFTQQYATGDPYAITSPKVPGYTADILRVTGVMEKQDMVYDVIYTAKDYTLTIEYIYLDGSEAAPTYTETLKAGEDYYVESPVISGYRASMKVVEGTMPARDVKYTVVYVKNGNGYIIIDDYDTPLGIGNVHLNAGECFE